MKKIILAYHMDDSRLGKLRYLCLRLGVVVQPVDPADYALPLAVLCGLAQRPEIIPVPESEFDDEMLVMQGFSGSQINTLLATMKQFRFAPVALKAMVTPTNIQWNSIQLHRELLAEHQAMQAGRQLHEQTEKHE